MSKEAMKLALEALEWNMDYLPSQGHGTGMAKKAITALREALAEQPAQPLPFGVGGGLVAIKTLLSRDPCVHANTAIQMIDAILAEQPAQQEPALQPAGLRDAVYTVLEGFTLPHDVRKILETAYYGPASTTQPAQQQECHCNQGQVCHVCDPIHPPSQRTWVGLTAEDRVELWKKNSSIDSFVNATEARLKELNT